MQQFPDITSVLTTVPWAVIDGVATRLYMPERVTQDLDIVVRQEDGAEVRRMLVDGGFGLQGKLGVGGSSWTSPSGANLDVVETDAPWLDQALAEALHNRDVQGMPVLPLAYLVLMKFESGRVQDLADVTRMLGQADQQGLQAVQRLFAEYLPAEMDDLESLIVLGQMEANPS